VGPLPLNRKKKGGFLSANIALTIDYTATQFDFKFKLPSTKTIKIYWGDGTSEEVVGQDSTLITKTSSYSSAGEYKFWVSGDDTDITYIDIGSQAFVSGDVSSWSKLVNLTYINCGVTSVSGDMSLWSVLTSLTYINCGGTDVYGDVSGWNALTSLEILFLTGTDVYGDVSGWNSLTSINDRINCYSTDVSFNNTPAWAVSGIAINFLSNNWTAQEVDNAIASLKTCTNCTIRVDGTNAHRTADSNDDLNTLLANGNTITLNDVLGDELYTSLNAANDNATEDITAFADYAATIDGGTQVTQGQDITKMLPLGSEEVTNGDFSAWTGDDPDGWSITGEDAGNYFTEDSGKCRIVSDGGNLYMSQIVLNVGKYYIISIDVTDVTSGELWVYNTGGGLFPLDTTITGTGTTSVVFRSSADRFYIRSASGDSCDITIDNVSVKEIEVLGDDLVTDGGFADITKAAAKGVAGITKANPGVVTFDADHGYADGDVIYFSGLSEMTELNGEYWKLTNNSGDTFELDAGGSSLDTSGYGSAETTGGNCAQSCSLTEWTEGIGWHPGVDGAGALSNVVSCDGSQASGSYLQQITGIVAGEAAIVKFTVSNYSAGSIERIYTSSLTYISTSINANGTYTFVMKEDDPSATRRIYIRADADFIGDIDNFSCHKLTVTKEIAGSTNYTGTHYVLPEEGEDLDSFIIPVAYVAEAISAQKITGEYNATTGWTAANNAVLSVESVNVQAGSYALKVESNTTPTNEANIKVDLESLYTEGNIYRVIINYRHIGTGGGWRVQMGLSGTSPSGWYSDVLYAGDTTYKESTVYFTYSANFRYINARELSATNNGGVYIDNISIKQVTLSG
jgi:hypothetical protein